jgi:cyclomaltodextrinase
MVLPETPLAIKIGLYEHYKGGKYEVMGVCRHTETLEEMVIYRALYGDGDLWVRPHAMFTEMVDKIPRFRFLGVKELAES